MHTVSVLMMIPHSFRHQPTTSYFTDPSPSTLDRNRPMLPRRVSYNNDYLPESVLHLISTCLPPTDRLRLQQTCRRFHDALSSWADVTAVEIGSGDRVDASLVESSPTSRSFPAFISIKTRKKCGSYRVKIITASGREYSLRNTGEEACSSAKSLKELLRRLVRLDELTISNACLGNESSSAVSRLTDVATLRLWNCAGYFERLGAVCVYAIGSTKQATLAPYHQKSLGVSSRYRI